jgi:hypothetical protein
MSMTTAIPKLLMLSATMMSGACVVGESATGGTSANIVQGPFGLTRGGLGTEIVNAGGVNVYLTNDHEHLVFSDGSQIDCVYARATFELNVDAPPWDTRVVGDLTIQCNYNRDDQEIIDRVFDDGGVNYTRFMIEAACCFDGAAVNGSTLTWTVDN